MHFENITVTLLDGSTVPFKDCQFLDVARKCLSNPLKEQHPILINIENVSKVYVDDTQLQNWIEKKITTLELFETCEVDNLARNILPIETEHFTIDDGSLFKVKANTCILVDDDMDVSILFDDNHFAVLE